MVRPSSRHKPRDRKTYYVILGALVIALATGGVMFLAYSPQSGHPETLLHLHVQLTIYDVELNRNVTIPANIGIAPHLWLNHTWDSFGSQGMAPIHTHDESGLIHVESSRLAVFTLKDFFNIWGERLTKTCVMYYCANVDAGRLPPFMGAGPRDKVVEQCVDPSFFLQDNNVITIIFGGGPPETLTCTE